MAKRVKEELEKRKDEIEAEILRRVEEAKKIMEREMMEEIQKQREKEMQENRRREVKFSSLVSTHCLKPIDRSLAKIHSFLKLSCLFSGNPF